MIKEKAVAARSLDRPFLPFNRPDVGEDEIAEVVDTLRSGWLTTGPKTHAFETEFAAAVGARHAIAVSSCTDGMLVALTALGIGPGDEVIVPTMTFAATANVVIHLGARPVFVDVSADTLNINPVAAATAVTPRTKAIIPVHLYGHPCDMDALQALAARRGLFLVEDAAHAVGAAWRGRAVGSIGQATVFSFYATKNLVTGEGGMITTNDDALAANMRRWVLHGIDRDAWNRYAAGGRWYYEIVCPGYKCNMMDIQAALGLHQLRRLPAMQQRRQEIVNIYNAGLWDLPALTLPACRPRMQHAWHLYAIRLRLSRLAINRAGFIDALQQAGIGTSVHFIPLHRHPYYRQQYGLSAAQFPVADAAFERLISLPLYSRMTDDDAQRVVDAVRCCAAQHQGDSLRASV